MGERPLRADAGCHPRGLSWGRRKVADVVVRYVSGGEEIAAHEVTLPLMVNLVNADEAAAAAPDAQVVEEVIVLKAARAQEEVRRRADAGDFEGARTVLADAVEDLRSVAPGSERAAQLDEDPRALEEAAAELSPFAYEASTRKRMHHRSHQMRRRRPLR